MNFRTLFLIAFLPFAVHASTLEELLTDLSTRVFAVLDQYTEQGEGVNVTKGSYAGKVLRTYDYHVIIQRADNVQVRKTQQILVYDKDGDAEYAVYGGSIRSNDEGKEPEATALTKGKKLLRQVIDGNVKMTAKILDLPGEAIYEIDDYEGLPDIKVAGENVPRLRLWLSDGTVIVRSPQFTADGKFEFWKVGE